MATKHHTAIGGQRVKIRQTNDGGWSMTIDGEPFPNVRGVEFISYVDDVATVKVEFLPSDVEIEADVRVVRNPLLLPWFHWPGWSAYWRNAKAWARYRWRYGW